MTYKMRKGYEARRRREGAKAATIHDELVVLGRMFTLAIQHELLTTKPLPPEIKVSNAGCRGTISFCTSKRPRRFSWAAKGKVRPWKGQGLQGGGDTG